MAWRCLGRRTVRPVFGNDLPPVVERGAEAPDGFSLLKILTLRVLRWPGRTKLVRPCERKRRDMSPMRREKRLRRAGCRQQRLPPIWVDELRRCVHGHVTRIVGVRRAAVEIAELIRAIVVPPLEHCIAREVADSHWSRWIGGSIDWIEADLPHDLIDRRPLGWKQVEQRCICRIADRHILCADSPLAPRPSERVPEYGPHGLSVVGRPRVVHACVHDGKRSSGEHWCEPNCAHGVEQRGIPDQNDVVTL